MPPIRFQLGFTRSPGANSTTLPAETGPHAGKPREQILILGKLYLKSAFFRAGPLGKNIQNQGTAVQNRYADQFLQRPDISGRKGVIENYHGAFRCLGKHSDFLCLPCANKAVRIRRMPVLQNLRRAESASRLQKCVQFLQTLFRCHFFRRKAIRVQADKNGPLLYRFVKS